MPGPPVSTILTSSDIGLGTNEMKVKGTFVVGKGFITSRYLFTSPEEEAAFFKNNPWYKEGFLDLDDEGKPREPNVPFKMKNQLKQDIGEKVPGSPPKKPAFKAFKTNRGKAGRVK